MINVIYGNNTNRSNDVVKDEVTVREFLDSHKVDGGGSLIVNGERLDPVEFDTPLSNWGDRVYLLKIFKADNAFAGKSFIGVENC